VIKIHLPNPLLDQRLKHKEYVITAWLWHQQIKYRKTEVDPDWVVIHPLWGNFLQSNDKMLSNLPKHILERLAQGKTGLIFWYPYETEHYAEVSVTQQIEKLLDTITVKKCLYVTGNLNTDPFYPENKLNTSIFYKSMNYDDLLVQALQDNQPRIVKVPLLFFDYQIHNHLKTNGEDDQIIHENWYNWNKSKDYICLNGKAKPHRRYMIQKLLENNLADNGLLSYVCYDGVDPLQGPIYLDQNETQIRRNDRYMNPGVYNNSWINIVTEAFPHVEQDMFITEKTFKPMLQLQPFMVLGNRGTLKRLKQYGYRTFDQIWDESYDDLPTWQQRADAIVKNLKQWCAKSKEQKQQDIKLVWKNILRNQYKVCNTEFDSTRSAYLQAIVKAVSSGG
tara:strand:+ start:2342 stop:3517 length:1176 start_codon:yes stop_codon:yes gene_type:complete